jgi:hypothetical protein
MNNVIVTIKTKALVIISICTAWRGSDEDISDFRGRVCNTPISYILEGCVAYIESVWFIKTLIGVKSHIAYLLNGTRL